MIPIDEHDWNRATAELDERGWAVLPKLLNRDQCLATAALYDREAGFRKEVVMERHGYGRGAYRYFAYPLPELVQDVRSALYPR
ncbi:MAG: proline hydroxylase, partial [Rhizorhabdus sp.]